MATRPIPYRKSLPWSPEILQLSDLSERSPRDVTGMLLDLWTWFDEYGKDGYIEHGKLEMLPNVVSWSDMEFFVLLEDMGWLVETPQGLNIPGYDRDMEKYFHRRQQILGVSRGTDRIYPPQEVGA